MWYTEGNAKGGGSFRLIGSARRILKAIAKNGELSLDAALRIATPCHRNHIDQYPLALLIEEQYAGMTINHIPPEGAEAMREFCLATTLHMFTLPKNDQGEAHYLDITSSRSIDPREERVFLKAKGALYLDAEREKRRDRLYSFIIGFSGGFLAAFLSGWFLSQLKLP